MKTINANLILAFLISLICCTSCNNDIVSTAGIDNSTEQSNSNEASGLIFKISLDISIEPYQSYSFHYENTGIRLFKSISVSDCDKLQNDIQIFGYTDDGMLYLDCNSSNLSVYSIDIYNMTGDQLNLLVNLTGSKTYTPINIKIFEF